MPTRLLPPCRSGRRRGPGTSYPRRRSCVLRRDVWTEGLLLGLQRGQRICRLGDGRLLLQVAAKHKLSGHLVRGEVLEEAVVLEGPFQGFQNLLEAGFGFSAHRSPSRLSTSSCIWRIRLMAGPCG